jgi:hypothetical protein
MAATTGGVPSVTACGPGKRSPIVRAVPGELALPFLHRLRRAMLEDLEPEITLACKVGVLLAAGHKRMTVKRLLDAPDSDFRRAIARLERAAERLDQGPSAR